MIKKVFTISILLFLLIGCRTTKLENNETKPFSSLLKWTGAKLEDENYSTWRSSPIMGDDGNIHVFCCPLA